MDPTFLNQFNTAAAAVTSLSHTLQQAPEAEEFPTHTEADANFINSRVSEVDLLFGELFKYRAALQHNLNLRVSRICKIPSETLGEIFKYACDSSSKKAMMPTEIGVICHHWRQVAWSVPQLWTELTVGERFWNSPLALRVKLLELFFKNIGGLHCSVTFLWVPDSPPGEGRKASRRVPQKTVFDLLFVKHADKLKALTFYNTPEPWLLHINKVTKSGQGLPNLESFAVLDRDEYLENLTFDLDLSPLVLYNVPRLRKLILEGVAQTLIFPWAQLTELSFYNISSATALNIVLQCKDLVTLKLNDILDDASITLPSEPTVLRSLQKLKYEGLLVSHWEEALAKCLLFTSLERLTWSTAGGTRNLRKRFLLRLPTSITHLRLDCRGERDNIQDLKRIFARLTSLHTLALGLDDPLDIKVVRLFMVADRRSFLPSLRSAEFIMMRPECGPQQISDLLDIVRSRWVMQGQKDSFEGFEFRFPFAELDSPSQVSNFMRSVDRIMGKEV